MDNYRERSSGVRGRESMLLKSHGPSLNGGAVPQTRLSWTKAQSLLLRAS